MSGVLFEEGDCPVKCGGKAVFRTLVDFPDGSAGTWYCWSCKHNGTFNQTIVIEDFEQKTETPNDIFKEAPVEHA